MKKLLLLLAVLFAAFSAKADDWVLQVLLSDGQVVSIKLSEEPRTTYQNGSWAPSAGRVMREMIEAMKDCQIVEPMVTIRSRMKPADEAQLALLAEAVLS
ncbi:MAG: hypothetical protein IK144_12875 [Bacteroidaceae bacterium]|nr:hypothetical protein [Bacteroidaceae bacterium]